MSADLKPVAQPLRVHRFTLERTGLRTSLEAGKPSFEDWAALGEYLRHVEAAVQWWVGDWLAYGEEAFGQEFSQVLDRYEEETLRVCQWVAQRIPPVRRRTALDWSHHREVAALPPEQQDRLLDLAESERLTTRGLRLLVKKSRGEPLPSVPETPLDRLRAAWKEATPGEREVFLGEVVRV